MGVILSGAKDLKAKPTSFEVGFEDSSGISCPQNDKQLILRQTLLYKTVFYFARSFAAASRCMASYSSSGSSRTMAWGFFLPLSWSMVTKVR